MVRRELLVNQLATSADADENRKLLWTERAMARNEERHILEQPDTTV
jgi:hypothetical protein